MYTLTIKIAATDTKYTNDKGESHPSKLGHMWYSLSDPLVPTLLSSSRSHSPEWECILN